MRAWRPARTLVVLACLAGCAPTPVLSVEPAVLSDDWSRPTTLSEGPPPPLGVLLGVPQLEALIAAGADRNPTIGAARARLDQSVALLRVARGEALPLISASVGLQGSRVSRGAAFDFNTSFARLDTMLTPDLSGIQSARNRGAAARAAAGYQDFQAAALGVSVQIARAYVQAVTLGRRLRLIDTSIAQGAELDRILRIRQREGAASMVELGLQSIRLKQLRTERSRIDEALDQSRTALAVLVGEEASRFDLALDGAVTFSKPTLGVPAPAELVRMRPDIRSAEARIQTAGGDVAAARRAFYPSISLSAGGAVSAGALAPLAVAQQIGADILAPIFARNRLRGELELASAQQREAVSNYQAVLLNAFREVEDALSLVAHADEREKLLTDVEAEARLTETLARRQYLEGAADLQHLLDAQDLLISVQDALALGQQERIEGLIQIYAATAASA